MRVFPAAFLAVVIVLTGGTLSAAEQNAYENMDLYEAYHSTVGCPQLDDAMQFKKLVEEEDWPAANELVHVKNCRFVKKGEVGRLITVAKPIICLAMGPEKRMPDPENKRESLCFDGRVLER